MKLKMTSAAIIAAIAAVSAAGSASAQDATFAFNVAGTTDYRFRGVSQTDESPSLSAGADVTVGSYYAGVWASNVDFGDDTSAEVDLYGGYRTEAGGFNFDLGAIAYVYVGEPNRAAYNYVEAKLGVSRAFGPLTAGVAAYISPDFFGVDEVATYFEANYSYAVTDKLSISGAIGEQFLDKTADYVTYNVGASYALTSNLIADVRYVDTDLDTGGIVNDTVVGTIKVVF